MKLLTSISSIRRSASKQCRSCSPDSASMCAGLAGEPAAGRVHPLAGALEHAGDRVLGEPVDLHVVVALRAAPGRSRRRGGRGRGRSARRGRGPSSAAQRPRTQVGGGGRCEPRGEVADQVVDLHRVAGERDVAAALEDDELAAGELGDRARPRACGLIRSRSPWITSIGLVDRLAPRRRTSPGSGQLRPSLGGEHVGGGRRAPADAVLDLLRRVRSRGSTCRRRTRGSPRGASAQ